LCGGFKVDCLLEEKRKTWEICFLSLADLRTYSPGFVLTQFLTGKWPALSLKVATYIIPTPLSTTSISTLLSGLRQDYKSIWSDSKVEGKFLILFN
jgi:hypothetical protein